MSKYTNALYPDKINDLVDNDGNVNPSMVPGGVEIAGNALVIPEKPAPEPVITIDGVAYFHKQEFDLEELLEYNDYTAINILNGEILSSAHDASCFYRNYASAGTAKTELIALLLNWGIRLTVFKAEDDPVHVAVDFTSRAFTVVDTQQQVTDDTQICLPTCSAYYGFLSEDGKTFISYYNLKNEGPEYIDSIKQGNAVIPLKGGVKLYKHDFGTIDFAGANVNVYIISTQQTAYKSINDIVADVNIIAIRQATSTSYGEGDIHLYRHQGTFKGFYRVQYSTDSTVNITTTGDSTISFTDTVIEL